MNTAAFLSYIFLTSFTPGPNNIMAMTNSARLGLRRSLPFCFGVFLGFLIDMSICAVFTSVLFQYIPALTPMLKWVGTAYILFLALLIWRDRPSSKKCILSLEPASPLTGAVMQCVNVKVILYGIAALSTFILPYYQSPRALALFVLALSLTGFAGTCCWTLFGAFLQDVYSRRRKLLNGVMALLLVYCAAASIMK